MLSLHLLLLLHLSYAAYPKRKNEHCSVQVNSLCYDDELDNRPIKIIHDRQGLRVSGTKATPSQSNDQLLPKASSEHNGFRLSSLFNTGRLFQTINSHPLQTITTTTISNVLPNQITNGNRAQSIPDTLISSLVNSWTSFSDVLRNGLLQTINETSLTNTPKNVSITTPVTYRQMTAAGSVVQPLTYFPPFLIPTFAPSLLHSLPVEINSMVRYSVPPIPIVKFHPIQSLQHSAIDLNNNYQSITNPSQRRVSKEKPVFIKVASLNRQIKHPLISSAVDTANFSISQNYTPPSLLEQSQKSLIANKNVDILNIHASPPVMDPPVNFTFKNTKKNVQPWTNVHRQPEVNQKILTPEIKQLDHTFQELHTVDKLKPFNVSSIFPKSKLITTSNTWQPIKIINNSNASVFSSKDDSKLSKPIEISESKEASLLAKYPLHSPVELYTLSPISISGHNLQIWDEEKENKNKKGLIKLMKHVKQTKKTFIKEKKQWKKNEFEAFKIRKKIAAERYRANDPTQKLASANYAMRRITLDMVSQFFKNIFFEIGHKCGIKCK